MLRSFCENMLAIGGQSNRRHQTSTRCYTLIPPTMRKRDRGSSQRGLAIQRGSAIAKVGKLTRVNMSLTPSCKLVEFFCNDLCCFATKSRARFDCTFALNPPFSVAPIESSRYGGPLLRRTTIGGPLEPAPWLFCPYFIQHGVPTAIGSPKHTYHEHTQTHY